MTPVALKLSLDNYTSSCILQFSLINCHFVSIHKEEQYSQKSSFLAYVSLKTSVIFQPLLTFWNLTGSETKKVGE